MPKNIAHLSDIHFRHNPNQIGHDADEKMRDELVRDLIKHVQKWGKLDALVVSGDIAFSGKVEEFALAKEWFTDIVRRTESPDCKVIICPGNHDIDRAVLKAQPLIEDGHTAVRSGADNEKREAELIRRLSVKDTRDLFYKALENYNNFAQQYNCSFYANRENYSWSHDLLLDDGSKLRIRGLNSTTLCGQNDQKGKLFLGRSAWDIKREDGVAHMVFAHHPPSWLLDGSEMTNELDDRTAIQLYGHEHAARVTSSGGSVVLFAGSVNPARDEQGWMPGYNFLRISIDTVNTKRHMIVKVFAREWQAQNPAQFKDYKGKQDDGSHEFSVPLEAWSPPVAYQTPQIIENSKTVLQDELVPAGPEAIALTPDSEILKKFYDLAYSAQYDILERLGLLKSDESNLPQFLQINRAVERASQEKRINELK